MSQGKRGLEEHEDLLMAIEALGIKEKPECTMRILTRSVRLRTNRRTRTFMQEHSTNGLRAI